MSSAPAPVPQTRRLIAPLWHTAILLLWLLVPPSFWPGWKMLMRAVPYNTGATDLLEIVLETVNVALVCISVSLYHTPLEELIGRLWMRWRDIGRDASLGLALCLFVRYADRLLYYFLGSPRATSHRLWPHTKGELFMDSLLAIAAGVGEELVFRGYLQKQFAAVTRTVGQSVVLQAAVFACFHGYHQTLALFAQHFLFGLLAGGLAQWRKSLLPGMIGHAMWDIFVSWQRFIRVS